jgi:hypothetical protein
MRLLIKKKLNKEIIHYASDDLFISSHYNRIFLTKNGHEKVIQLPGDGWKGLLGLVRLTRRAARLDKCNIFPVNEGLVIIRQGLVYRYDLEKNVLSQTLKLMNCRNILHQGMCRTERGDLFFGEYGNNPNRTAVPIYRSQDFGLSWQTIYSFPTGKIKHVHGCYWDQIEKKVWIFTGDFKGECYALCTDPDFKKVEWIGDGHQVYRMCNAFFEESAIHWIMDSQLEDSYHIKMDRKTRLVEKLTIFPGPVWYIKQLKDGYYIAATAQEIGPGVHDGFSHLMASRDLVHWEDIHQFRHDGLPKRLFKFGVAAFADGDQTSQGFYIFGEALKELDGKSILCQIEN